MDQQQAQTSQYMAKATKISFLNNKAVHQWEASCPTEAVRTWQLALRAVKLLESEQRQQGESSDDAQGNSDNLPVFSLSTATSERFLILVPTQQVAILSTTLLYNLAQAFQSLGRHDRAAGLYRLAHAMARRSPALFALFNNNNNRRRARAVDTEPTVPQPPCKRMRMAAAAA